MHARLKSLRTATVYEFEHEEADKLKAMIVLIGGQWHG